MTFRLAKIKVIMKKLFVLITVISGFAAISFAQIPDRPVPPRLVNDFANVLSAAEREFLEDTLVRFDRATSTQIVVVTVPDLQGYDPADFAYQIGEKWGVGQKWENNGVVILVKPKQGNSKGEVFIATGYGLEGVLPDAIVNSTVIDFEMIPYFRENNYYKGISDGVKVIMEITRGEYTAEIISSSVYKIQKVALFLPLLFLCLFLYLSCAGEETAFILQVRVYHFGLPWECYQVVEVLVARLVVFHPGAAVLAVSVVEVLAVVAPVEAGKLSLKFRVQSLKKKEKGKTEVKISFAFFYSESKIMVCSRFGPTEAIVTGIPISSSIKLM